MYLCSLVIKIYRIDFLFLSVDKTNEELGISSKIAPNF